MGTRIEAGGATPDVSQRPIASSAGPVFDGMTTVAVSWPSLTMRWPTDGTPSMPMNGHDPPLGRDVRRGLERAPRAARHGVVLAGDEVDAQALRRLQAQPLAHHLLGAFLRPLRVDDHHA